MIKAVIFDLDGTLLDTIEDIAAAHNHTLSAFGLPVREVDEFNTIIGQGLMEAVMRAAPPGTEQDTLVEMYRMYQAYYPEHCTELTHPYKGIIETIKKLAASGKALAVITNKTEGTAQKMVRHFFPDVDFKFVWGNDGTRPLKPEANAGAAACEVLALDAAEIAYVGDSDVDMLFALAVVFLPVGACWGYRGEMELRKAGAAFLAKEPQDILDFL